MHLWSPLRLRIKGFELMYVFFALFIDLWLHSRRFRISQTTNVRGRFCVWRLVRATERYRPSSFISRMP